MEYAEIYTSSTFQMDINMLPTTQKETGKYPQSLFFIIRINPIVKCNLVMVKRSQAQVNLNQNEIS